MTRTAETAEAVMLVRPAEKGQEEVAGEGMFVGLLAPGQVQRGDGFLIKRRLRAIGLVDDD